MGVKVYGAGAISVKENIALLRDNKLNELLINDTCQAHHGECGH